LGSFELFAPIARGGMGEVWRGRHIRQGVPVAVKVMTAEATRREDYLLDFRNEVRSVARLDHPGIVMVFDHGEVDQSAHRATKGRLVAGSPFLAMELASGGLRDLMRKQGSFSWSLLRAILLSILDALAHAHARGVIHRDLKPHNVLQFKEGSLKLSDFGIAHVEGHETLHRVIGTPAYMSPEQLLRHWRDYGPWTDLYALGILAFQLSTGKLPFRGSGPSLQRAHLYDEPPPLKPRAPVPERFRAWVERLLDKRPRARFLRAADAAFALQEMAAPVGGEAAPEELALALSVSREVTTFDFSAAELLDEVPEAPVARSRQPSVVFGLPEVPVSWRKRVSPSAAPQLLDAGLGLFAMRSFRLVGRERERDLLWRALCQVHGAGAARLCVVRGVAGIGKSRLVRWIVDRAHEVGAAEVLSCHHDPNDDAGEATRRMLHRFLDTERLAKPTLRLRLKELLAGWSDASRESLVELLLPNLEELDSSVRLQHPRERYAVLEHFLRRMCEERPVILVLEDVHWGPESLGLAEYLLEVQSERSFPLLLLLTVRDDRVSEDPRVAERLDALTGYAAVRQISLSPLDAVERAQLVRELLGLEDTLAATVEDRTAGNPAFTIQLVGDWVERGVLKVGAHGFTLQEGERALLPTDLRDVADIRVREILSGLPSIAQAYLERAAALGRDVDNDEWQVACDCEVREDWTREGSFVSFSPEGARIRAILVDRLLAQHHAEETEYGWSFVQGAFRESLVISAQQSGRWAAHHLACAAVLRHRHDAEVSAERVGRHLLAAGAVEPALELLMSAVVGLRKTSNYREALGLIGSCEEALKELGCEEDDPRWGELMLQRVAIQSLQGDISQAMRWANRVVLLAQRHVWDEVLPVALVEKASVSVLRRDLALAEQLLDQARECVGDGLELARWLQVMARVQVGRGDLERACELYSEARSLYAAAGDEFGEAECWRELAPHEETRRGISLLERAREVYKRLGIRNGIAHCYSGIADLQRRSGDHHEAETGFRRAIALFDALGGRLGQGVVPRMNLGLLFLERGDFDNAKDLFEEARVALASKRQVPLLAATNVALMVTAAAERDWQTWDRCHGAAETLLRRSRYRHRDTARVAGMAGRLAATAEEPGRAAQAWSIARAQYESLGDAEGLQEVESWLAGLEPD